jgi:hypothetical protein
VTTQLQLTNISYFISFISDKAFVLFEVVTGYYMLKGKGKGHARKGHEGPEWK